MEVRKRVGKSDVPEGTVLEDLLGSLGEAGRWDSRGSFTLSGRKAAGKLARSLLPDPADWILKVVQAVCQAKAPELRISQTHKATHLAFRLPYPVDMRALEASLTRAVTPAQPGLEDLCSALRVVGLGQERPWVARLRSEESLHWVLVDDGMVSLESSPEPDGPRGQTEVLIGLAFPPGESGKVGGLVRFGAAIQNEHEALAQRARACPVPLWLDGERLDTMRRSANLAGFEREVFLGVVSGSQPTATPIRFPDGVEESQSQKMGANLEDPNPFHLPDASQRGEGSSLLRIAFRYNSERHPRERTNRVFRPLPTPSRVLLLRHGVVVGRRNLGFSEPVAVDVYLNADHERSDLSGLEVDVQPHHVEQARAELRELGEVLSLLERKLSAHICPPRRLDLALSAGVSGTALFLAPWPVKLVALGLSAWNLRNSAFQQQKVIDLCRLELSAFGQRYCRLRATDEPLTNT